MATQPKLPHTLPTPRAAKAALRGVLEEISAQREAIRGLKDQVKRAKEDAAEAERQITAAERDLLQAEDDSPEELDASAREVAALVLLEKAEDAGRKADGILKRANRELEEMTARLAGVRGDLRAIQQGRQRRK